MKVLVATKNQGKIEGAKRALKNYFDNVEIQGVFDKLKVDQKFN